MKFLSNANHHWKILSLLVVMGYVALAIMAGGLMLAFCELAWFYCYRWR